jgi:hypothetical protein
MKKLKVMSIVFWVFSVLLSNVMCATVAYNYCHMVYSIKYEGFSAPANVAFVLAVPYLIGIIICAGLAISFQKKSSKLI